MARARKPQRVLGIEICARRIRIAEVQREGRLPSILKGVVAERPSRDEEIAAEVSRLIEQEGMESREAVVSIPADRAFLRQLSMDTRERRARRAAEMRFNIPEDRLIFNYVVQGKTAEGRHAVLMVAIPRDIIEAHRRMLAPGGVKVLSMVAGPLGFLAAHRMDETVPQKSLVLAVHGFPGGCADFVLVDGGRLLWAESSDVAVPFEGDPGQDAEFWWAATCWLTERADLLNELTGNRPVGQNLLVSGVPGPDPETRKMLEEHLGTGYVFHPGDGIEPELRIAYGLALMELGFAVPADLSFLPSLSAARKVWLQNAILAAGAVGFAYSAFLTNLAVRQKRIGAIETEASRIEVCADSLVPKTQRVRDMRTLLTALPSVLADRLPLEQLRRIWAGLPDGARIARFESRADGSFQLDFTGCSGTHLEQALIRDVPGLRVESVQDAPGESEHPAGVLRGRWVREDT